jgi:hypothetical protein
MHLVAKYLSQISNFAIFETKRTENGSKKDKVFIMNECESENAVFLFLGLDHKLIKRKNGRQR